MRDSLLLTKVLGRVERLERNESLYERWVTLGCYDPSLAPPSQILMVRLIIPHNSSQHNSQEEKPPPTNTPSLWYYSHSISQTAKYHSCWPLIFWLRIFFRICGWCLVSDLRILYKWTFRFDAEYTGTNTPFWMSRMQIKLKVCFVGNKWRLNARHDKVGRASFTSSN